MQPLRLLLSLTLALCVAMLVFGPALAQQGLAPPAPEQADAEEKQDPQPPTLTDQIGGDDRYLTHLSTDKPIYRAGEKVYLRGTVLHAFDRTPYGVKEGDDNPNVRRGQRMGVLLEIKDPKGAVLASAMAGIEDGVFGFAWEVPEGQAGGEYTIRASYPWLGLAPAERTFDIRAYRPPRIRSQIDFVKDGYGPGDTVIATIDATRAEGGVPEGAKVTAVARLDGAEVARVQTTISAAGTAEARFDLPDEIARGEGSLAFIIEDGGVVETASKTIPILLQTVDLSIYPEGGDLVAGGLIGVENRVYFQAMTPYGKPADIKGRLVEIVERNGEQAYVPLDADFETMHEGRGVFALQVKQGVRYGMQVTEPASVTQVFELPSSKTAGAQILPWNGVIDGRLGVDAVADIQRGSTDGVFAFDEPISFQVFVPGHSAFTMHIRHRERVVWEDSFVDIDQNEGDEHGLLQGRPDVILPHVDDLPDSATGILTVTAYDAEGNPLAERLIYRAPKDQVNLEVLPDSAQYTPGGKVQLTIKTTDAAGNPVSAMAGLTVTDDAVLEMIETREQAPALPAMVLLEPEVRELADAQVYLDPDNPDAAMQLDLLLGTQGWRRFALVDLPTFIREHGDDARRALAFRRPVRAERARAVRRLDRAVPEAEFLEDGAAMPVPMAAQVGQGEGEGVEIEEAVDDLQAVPAPDPVALPVNEPVDEDRLDEALNEAEEEDQAAPILADEDVRRQRRMPPRMVFIREYAHTQPAGKPFGERSDFTETVYWSAMTKTNDSGLATVEFALSDSVTSFRVKADAFTRAGALGAGTALIESVRPFYIEPKLPLELTAGDKVLLPIALVNNTDRALPVDLRISNLGRAGQSRLDVVQLGADERGRALHELTIGQAFGDLPLTLTARAGGLFDENKRSLRVVPRGFPIDDGSGGMLTPGSGVKEQIEIPDTIVPGSLQASVTVYPTPMANLTEALEALIRDPYGCFEQTSSTTFPLVMAQQYFLTHQGIDPKIIAAAQEKLDAGYQRLIGFETEQDGYEWFGSTPPHESLTAYGLLQFNEMKQVMDVDQAMIERTQNWLMSRCNDDGSFELDSKALDSFGRAPQDTTDAYIVWSLLEAGYDPAKIEKSIDLVLTKATDGNDAYIIALGANIAQLAADRAEVFKREDGEVDASEQKQNEYQATALLLRQKIAGKLNDEGFVDGAVTSITNSGGDALKIETTSLAILAWLKDDSYTPQVEKSILWLTERCKAGRFGSTQSTVLALKAIVEYDKARSTPKAPGSLVLTVDGEAVGEPIAFDQETKGAIKLPRVDHLLTPGGHTIGIEMVDGSKMPYSIAVEYFAETPSSSDESKLRIETSMSAINPSRGERGASPYLVREGETTEVNVVVTNITADGLPTPIAIVGIPGGLEPDYDQLKELVAVETIAAFEVIGRDVVLYWREMKPEQVVELSIRCVAAVPGTYTGPASRAYLYYTDEHKHWAEGLAVNITPIAQD
ncbi:MAG: alpha-2-macroglobulin family protein [Planctomycetota bacterium]